MQIATFLRVGLVTLATASLLAGCSGKKESAEPADASAPDAAAEEAAAPADADAAAVPGKIDIDAVRQEARTAMFVPAPTEFQAALRASNVSIDIKALVKDGERKFEGKTRSIVALETGVRIANLLLSVNEPDKALVKQRMQLAREGLVALGCPDELVADVDRTIADFDKGAITTGEMGPALDVLAERVHDDLAEQADPAIATLVQAGGWVQGVHLLATSLANGGVSGEAPALLHQPTVLAHFMKFLKESDAGRAGDPDVAAVVGEMEKMKVIAEKDTLGLDDVKAVAAHTAAILAWF